MMGKEGGWRAISSALFLLDNKVTLVPNGGLTMKPKKSPFQPHALLWWVAIISLAVSIALYFLLGAQAEIDVGMRSQRMVFPLVGIVIAGVCLIAGTAGRWFYPK